jgi:hypothetical protein
MSTFAKRPQGYENRDAMNRRLDRLARESRLLDPHTALILARGIVAQLLEEGISYADFQSAQHAESSIGKASRLLDKVS